MLEVTNLSRSFGGLKVIDRLNLVVGRGEILGILGPNGAGKSTLFNLITGVLPPSSGSIRLLGRELTGLRTWDRCRFGVGRTYQVPKPFGRMSVFENVLVAAVHGAGARIGQARPRVAAVLELTGLAQRQAEPAARLSLLDLKRLELCKALAVNPKLLLLDEIAAGLSEPERDTLLGILRRVTGRDVTVIWIEHVVQILRQIATRLAVLQGGAIVASGKPDAILADARVKRVYLGS
jgi:branched-chain amino acid transport system ATP-binding protein